ncbi:small, acid-soluble spore protein, alpha/beta type [Desulfofalx alkaliphila]|uniref:small, acid-soluble spore protein, alpha/beta type n=1 Tax=Desulfofalx alkaliphila TaxID=105483 RepID=UPI0004E0B831|nr:small, acid-soluble spore protein, alpha/beta type [Desulfofalx alkaliphila]
MARRKLMSDALKYEMAQEMGVAHKIKGSDYGDLTSRECGNFVALAIQRAERSLV